MAKRKRKVILYFFLALILLGSSFILFNEYGLIRYLGMEEEIDSLRLKLETVKTENRKLQNEIDSLKNKIPAKMEQVAREKYEMKREGELSIEVRENDE